MRSEAKLAVAALEASQTEAAAATTALEEAVNAIMGIIYIFAKKVSD